jgi:hypothetical protein
MWDYYAHTQGGEAVLKWNRIHVDENMPPLLGNAVRKDKASQRNQGTGSNTTITTPTPDVSRRPIANLHQAPKGCLHWKIVWWVKGLMNHPILKAATNVGLLRTHTRGRGSIKIERSSRRREYATLIRECNNERQRFIKGNEAWGSKTKITTLTPNVRRRRRANIHQATQGLPLLENGLVGEGLNEPLNSQGHNQCGIITHTYKWERQY